MHLSHLKIQKNLLLVALHFRISTVEAPNQKKKQKKEKAEHFTSSKLRNEYVLSVSASSSFGKHFSIIHWPVVIQLSKYSSVQIYFLGLRKFLEHHHGHVFVGSEKKTQHPMVSTPKLHLEQKEKSATDRVK